MGGKKGYNMGYTVTHQQLTSNLTSIYKKCTPPFGGIPAHVPQPNSMEPQGIQCLNVKHLALMLKI
jgi:hypothetical protein